MKLNLVWLNSNEIPILEILLTKDKKISVKLLSKLKKIKKIVTIAKKYKNKWISS